MIGTHSQLRHELLAERKLSIDDYWAVAEKRLDWPLSDGLNLAHECCDRWATDRSRIALSVHEPDGSVTRWTYFELMEASRALANAFISAGFRRGDRVAAVLDQQVEAYICALAAWRAGLVYVPLFVGFGVDALAQRIDGAEATAVVVDHRYRAPYAKVHAGLTAGPSVWTVAGNRGLGIMVGDRSFWQEIDTHTAAFETVRTEPTDCATLIYTSGTTGNPKGCLHPHSLILPLQSFLRHVMAPGQDDFVFAGANPGWSFGLYAAGLGVQSLGIGRVIYTGAFDPVAWLKVMNKERVTYIASAPSAYRSLLAAARTSLPETVRGGLSAGEPLTASLVKAWGDLGGGPLQDGYGSSEMGMVLANLADDVCPAPAGALTSAVPGFDVVLVDEHGQQQETEGIIGVRNARWPILGYQGLDELWRSRTVNDVFLSGDMARRDEDGYYWFAGRHDDVIVTAGYNVGPAEVENVIAAVPGVCEVAVVAAPDEARGSVVRAVVVDDGSVPRTVLTGAIQDAAKERLGRHAYPKIIDFVDVLPRTEVGKVRRNILRENA
ncbi:acyl-CoA synthetase [[Mycobacterium] burgundiense]|uniref:AMP-binding protein n=1 Tax=[Mycobacterium] burgundiense TaxID=3064286 RepID=A0ABM9LHY7_9MYCO|nr:AMP-binding protein [Mycolicibacterium sp. MU0053]CAJ1499290.1 AMP-binding protein [Mycolicibacterium sp. MU0053]